MNVYVCFSGFTKTMQNIVYISISAIKLYFESLDKISKHCKS